MVKWMGALCILLASSGLGLHMAGQWKRRLRWLEQLRQMVYCLKGEILYSQAPLAEALERVGRRESGPVAQAFCSVSARIAAQDGEPLSQIWREETESLAALRPMPLTGEDLDRLGELGNYLGYLDLAMQERTLLLFLEQLDLSIAYLREHEKERSRLYTSLGIMGGLFLTISLS